MPYERWNANVLIAFGLSMGFVLGGGIPRADHIVDALILTADHAIALLVARLAALDAGNVAEWVAGTAALGSIVFGVLQLRKQTKQERLWSTLQACDRYDTDEILAKAKKTIASVDAPAQPYGQPAYDKAEVIGACKVLYNYFEAIAIGLDEKLYISEVVQDHLLPIMSEWRRWLLAKRDNHEPAIQEFFDTVADNYYGACTDLIIRWDDKHPDKPEGMVPRSE